MNMKPNPLFPFLPEDKVLIFGGENLKGRVLFPIIVSDVNGPNRYVFEDYELGREGALLYIREGLWQYNFGSLSDGCYYFSSSNIDESDRYDPFRPHLH